MKSRRAPLWIFIPGAIAFLVFAGYAALWARGAGEMRKAVNAWAEGFRGDGGSASFGAFKPSGFPFFLRGALTDVTVARDGWSWSAPRLFIDASPLAPDRLVFSARDPHVLQLGAADRWLIDAKDARASIARDVERGWLLDVQSGPGRIDSLNGKGAVAAKSFLLSAAPSPNDRARVFFGIDARDVAATRDGRTVGIDSAEIAVSVDRLVGARSLRNWRDQGGKVEVQRVALASGRGHAEFSGRLVLDAEGYPSGELAAEIVNPAPIAEALGAAGVIRTKDAASAAAGLALLSAASGGSIKAPLVFENGATHVAGVRLGKLPHVLRSSAAQP
jgi:hypothetical protein